MKQIRVSSFEKLLLSGVRTVGLARNLQILATPPVSTAAAERSFSARRRLKTYQGHLELLDIPETYLRTTMKNASLAWLLCQGIQTTPSTRRKFLKTLLRVKHGDQTLILNST